MTTLQTNMTNYGRRRVADRILRGLTVAATGAAIIPLFLIVGYVLVVGGGALNADFFTQTYLPPVPVETGPPGEQIDPITGLPIVIDPATGYALDPISGLPIDPVTQLPMELDPATGRPIDPATGQPIDPAQFPIASAPPPEASAATVEARGGVLHGIVGTLLVTLVALALALPIGILSGVFLAEYRDNPLATFVRFCCDVLSGAPSIVIGVVGYVLLVNQFKTYSGLAGSVALTFLMVPTIARTTEEMLKLVPNAVREAALALGAPTWYSTLTVVIPTALSGIVTGALLAFARGAGETAPLLLTIQGNTNLSFNLLAPIAALPLMTYKYIESPFPAENQLAWGTAFVLMMLVLGVNLLVRLVTARIRSG